MNVRQKVIATNAGIKSFLKKQRNAAYIDVFSPMLDANGKTRPELFLTDSLHMQPEGYALWKEIILPYLLQ
jgi:lysophospholipase L1-like esterase